MCVCCTPSALLNFCLCTASRGRKKGATGSRSLFTGLESSELQEWKTGKKKNHTAEQRGNSFQLKLPGVNEYSQVWFADILQQLLLFHRRKQNNSDDPDAPTANSAFIFSAIHDFPGESFMCLDRVR